MFMFLCLLCFFVIVYVSVVLYVLCPLCLYVDSGSPRPWMDSLDPETLYVSPEQAGQPALPLPNSEVSNLGG